MAFALIAIFALSAFVSTAAFGLTFELALWLINGVEPAAAVVSDTEGGLLFKNVLNNAELLCEGLFEGTVGPNSTGTVTKVFSLGGTEIGNLVGASLACTNVKLCEKAEIWPVNLPWTTEVEQDVEEPGLFFLLVTGAQYHVVCTVLGIKVEELCEALAGTAAMIENGASDVLGAIEAAEPMSTCSGNANDATVTPDPGNLTSVATGSLSVSL